MSSIISSGDGEQDSLWPSCPACPPGFFPLGLRRLFVLLTISSFMLSLLGGVLLLLEFFLGFSYLDRRSLSLAFSSSFLRIWWFRASMLRFSLAISAYCWSMVSRINLISTVMSCSTFDMSVTCSFIGIKVQKISHIRKKYRHFILSFYRSFCCIFQSRIKVQGYRWIVTQKIEKVINQ